MESHQKMVQPDIPHVLILPFPLQGHIKPMLSLAQILCYAGLRVTFLNTHHNHNCLTHLQSLSTRFPTLHFESISDGLPADHPRAGRRIADLISSIKSAAKPPFRELLISFCQNSDGRPPITCIIADGIMSFAIDVAEEFGIPVIIFRTFSACCLWLYFCIPKLIEEGELPFQANDDLDRKLTSVPGMEGLVRRRDLPGICRLKDVNDPALQFFVNETQAITRASSLILNTFDNLEAPILSRIAPLFPKIYTIGPLNALLKSHFRDSSPPFSSNGSLRKEDINCMTWLDSQPSKSVVYVSFGSIVTVTRAQMFEFWYGLVNSGKPFLWVIRSDLIDGQEEEQVITEELEAGAKERGCIVEWAPQEEVLAHRAVGGFLTHSGWNSTQEGIVAGVPMICWPLMGDQQINSRWVSEVWRIGLDMKDTCDRVTVEKMVKALMEDEREEIMRSVDRITGLARDSVCQGGSSYHNLEKLIEDIKKMGSKF